MKVQLRTLLTVLLLSAFFGWEGGQVAFALNESAAPQTSSSTNAPEKRQDPEEINVFRHAPIVQAIGRKLGLSTEHTAQIFEAINSGILILAVLFFLARVLPKAIRNRTAAIQKKLLEAQDETKTANERLSAVEAKLARIGEDIDAIRQQTERDSLEDEKRIKQSLEDERQRIVQAAEQEIESAGAAAKRELKRFAAELAVDNAARRIQLSYDSDKAIVERFGKDLTAEFGKGGRN